MPCLCRCEPRIQYLVNNVYNGAGPAAWVHYYRPLHPGQSKRYQPVSYSSRGKSGCLLFSSACLHGYTSFLLTYIHRFETHRSLFYPSAFKGHEHSSWSMGEKAFILVCHSKLQPIPFLIRQGTFLITYIPPLQIYCFGTCITFLIVIGDQVLLLLISAVRGSLAE